SRPPGTMAPRAGERETPRRRAHRQTAAAEEAHVKRLRGLVERRALLNPANAGGGHPSGSGACPPGSGGPPSGRGLVCRTSRREAPMKMSRSVLFPVALALLFGAGWATVPDALASQAGGLPELSEQVRALQALVGSLQAVVAQLQAANTDLGNA